MVATSLVTNVVRGRQAPDRLMLLIHGKGADEHDLEPLIPHLDPEGRFLTVLPRAPIPFMGGWQWYETDGIPKGGPESVRDGMAWLALVLDGERPAEPVPDFGIPVIP